jgi:hypothetical protein
VRFTNIAVTDSKGAARYHFKMGQSVRFRLSFVVKEDVPELYVSVMLRSGLSGEIVTSVKHPMSTTPLAAGQSSFVIIECSDFPIRPGQYPLYFWLGNSEAQPFDVVDDLTAPLTIKVGSALDSNDFHHEAPVGLVSIPSRIVDRG